MNNVKLLNEQTDGRTDGRTVRQTDDGLDKHCMSQSYTCQAYSPRMLDYIYCRFGIYNE